MSTDQTGKKRQRINVLSIDGGGIRGIIPAMVLEEIEKRTGKPICELFDIIAGTSVGGILALGLTKPKSAGSHEAAFAASELVELFEKKGKRIFPKSIWQKVMILFRAEYPSSGIDKILNEYFGDSRLKDALTPVIITTYDIENRLAFFFRSRKAQDPKLQATYDFPMKQVARATSAAPTYFRPAAIPKGTPAGDWALIDGGVYANNPAMCAYVEARGDLPEAKEICLVSLGTGHATIPIAYKQAKKWGQLGWVRPIIDITLDAPNGTVDYQMKILLPKPGDYYRIQTDLKDVTGGIDDTDESNINGLKDLAEKMIADPKTRIEEICSRLVQNKVSSR